MDFEAPEKIRYHIAPAPTASGWLDTTSESLQPSSLGGAAQYPSYLDPTAHELLRSGIPGPIMPPRTSGPRRPDSRCSPAAPQRPGVPPRLGRLGSTTQISVNLNPPAVQAAWGRRRRRQGPPGQSPPNLNSNFKFVQYGCPAASRQRRPAPPPATPPTPPAPPQPSPRFAHPPSQ